MGVDRDRFERAIEPAEARVEAWLEHIGAAERLAREGGAGRPDRGSRGQRAAGLPMLEGVRREAAGFSFTRDLLEAVVAEGDPFTAALGLREASRKLPASMPAKDRLAVRVGGVASLGLPWAVLPVARRWLHDRVASLVLAARLPDTAEVLAVIEAQRQAGCATVIALRGESVLGPAAVEREIARLVALASLDDLPSIALDPRRLIAGGSAWSIDRDAQLAALALRPVLEAAAAHDTELMIEPRDYVGALLAPEILVRALADTAFDGVRAGVTLLAELPESGALADRIIRFAAARRREGGAPITVTVDIAGIAGREQIASIMTGLAVPTLDGRVACEAQWIRLIDLLASAATDRSLTVVAATEDPHLAAAALELAAGHETAAEGERAATGERADKVEGEGSGDGEVRAESADREPNVGRLELQLRSGTAPGLAAALTAEGHQVRIHLPVATPAEFSGALDDLITLAAEAADSESTLARFAALLERAADPLDPLEDGRDGAHPGRARGEAALAAERQGLRRSLALAAKPFPASHRTQRRDREWDPSERDRALFYRPPGEPDQFDTGGLTAAVLGLTRGSTGELALQPVGPPVGVPAISASGFANEPDTDATRPENRDWVRRVLRQARAARGAAVVSATGSPVIPDTDELSPGAGSSVPSPAEPGSLVDPDTALDRALAAAEPWRGQRPADRATRVRRLALATVAARDRLLEVIALESGAPVAVMDAEISGAVDAARYLGQLAAGLGTVRGAVFEPDRVALVTAGAGVPLDERAEALAAVVAAGSAAVCVVHESVVRSTRALVEEWEAAGLPAGLVTVVESRADELDEVAGRIAADPRTDRALVLGSRDTAESLVRRRPDLRVTGRFRALGSTTLAASAQLSQSVHDVVRSAFGAAHASPNLARVLVLLGSAARSKRLREQLADAVRALRVGDTASPGDQDPLIFDVGPLPAPVTAAGRRALTELQPGEEWLVEPEQLDEVGRLWQPGVRIGVKRDSPFWADAVGVPVIGVITARTIDEASTLQTELGGGSVAGLHASDDREILPWLERTEAAALVVGRATVDARIERQPGGGWGRSGMGAAPLVGGPNRLLTLGSWRLRQGTRSQTLHLRGLEPEVQALIEAAQASLAYEEFDLVRRAALSDALTWRTTFGGLRDEVGLGVERNLLRRWPVATHVRLAEGASLAELMRVLAAALLVNAPLTVSTGEVLPAQVSSVLAHRGVAVSLERDEAWLERMATAGPGGGTDGFDAGGGSASVVATVPIAAPVTRVRLIGGDRTRAAEWMGGLARVTLWADPVTMAGPVELLAFLREQAIVVTAHRHGLASPVAGVDEWIAELDARVA